MTETPQGLPTQGLPTLAGLTALTAQWKGARAYVVNYVGRNDIQLGNNGDELLRLVFNAVLPNLGITLVQSPGDADFLIVMPGGALLDRYLAPLLLTKRLAALPDLPIVVFPSSSWFESHDPAQMFSGRTAPTLWISREGKSHRHLTESWGPSLAAAKVTLALDHDVVVSGHAYVANVLQSKSLPNKSAAQMGGPRKALLVCRLGAEAGNMERPIFRGTRSRRATVQAFRRMPRSTQIWLRRRATSARQQQANSRFYEQIRGYLPSQLATDPKNNFDISDPTLATFDQFAHIICASSIVVTNRLHVAIPAAILGKETYLADAGYHKLSGVYSQSLTKLPNVTFIPRLP